MFRLLVDHNQLEISKQKQIFRVLEKFYAEQDFLSHMNVESSEIVKFNLFALV